MDLRATLNKYHPFPSKKKIIINYYYLKLLFVVNDDVYNNRLYIMKTIQAYIILTQLSLASYIIEYQQYIFIY